MEREKQSEDFWLQQWHEKREMDDVYNVFECFSTTCQAQVDTMTDV